MTALVHNAKGRRQNQSESGYTRILGNSELGNLISKIHATSISAGTELEKIVWKKCNQITSIDDYLSADIYPTGVFLANKKQVKLSFIAQSSFEPDFIAFERKENNEQNCYVIELKDGDQFDTKKANAERTHLHNYLNFISRGIKFVTYSIVCSFNATSKEQIVSGFKNKITIDEAYTGREFCNLIGIDFDTIVQERKIDQENNINYFINSMLEIESVRNLIKKRLQDYR